MITRRRVLCALALVEGSLVLLDIYLLVTKKESLV